MKGVAIAPRGFFHFCKQTEVVVRHFSCLVPLAALLLAGCGGRMHLGGDPMLQVTDASELPAPTASDIAPADRSNLIAPFDKLSVTVFGIPELSLEEVQVDSGGLISVPLAGTVTAGGRPAEEVAREIESRLRGRYVREPQVAVNVRETLGRLVTVGGQVQEPGVYPVTPQMTLMSAVARAKGAAEFAELRDVVVFRTVNGQRMAALYNLAAIQSGAYQDPRVYPNDIIMVGDSPARRMFRDVLQAAPGIISPLIYILTSNNN